LDLGGTTGHHAEREHELPRLAEDDHPPLVVMSNHFTITRSSKPPVSLKSQLTSRERRGIRLVLAVRSTNSISAMASGLTHTASFIFSVVNSCFPSASFFLRKIHEWALARHLHVLNQFKYLPPCRGHETGRDPRCIVETPPL
jgi:hypothetical protein